jgi:hypothetical protein
MATKEFSRRTVYEPANHHAPDGASLARNGAGFVEFVAPVVADTRAQKGGDVSPRATKGAARTLAGLALLLLSAVFMASLGQSPLDFWYPPYAFIYDAIDQIAWKLFATRPFN